jgi:rSAM/selenodomain-associated transferase 2
MAPRKPRVSIIVPVLNEERVVGEFLRNVSARAAAAEVIVVDGGSSDATAEIASTMCERMIVAPRGRAQQMNAGANVARADVLWFLHVDVEPPIGCLDAIERALDAGAAGGYFRIHIPRRNPIYRLSDSFAHHAGNLLRIRCGDHGFFCRREVFDAIGGFPAVPLMEDVEFFRALRRRGKVLAVEPRLVVRPRRYEAIGPIRVTLAYGLIASLYALGAPWPLLVAFYRRFCCAR